MYTLKETSLEWALLHVLTYYDSDFFPRPFEFEAIKENWPVVREYLLTLDIEAYVPKNPITELSLKPNRNFRVVHQLDPIDSLIYTALLYENATLIESYRIKPERRIACAYRIKMNDEGSFFDENTGYNDFLEAAQDLCIKYPTGVVLVCDVVDFYNQISLEKIESVLKEAGCKTGEIVKSFLNTLNANTTRGVPVGPAPSILIAEAIMGDIDRKILLSTSHFTRYVDDLYVFFPTRHEATLFQQELTDYLYFIHRLVFSSEKTGIINVAAFKSQFLQEENVMETKAIREKLEELTSEGYPKVEKTREFDDLPSDEKKELRSEVYLDLLKGVLEKENINLGLARHVLRQAGKYKISNLIGNILDKFDMLLPVVREIVVYFERVLDQNLVKEHEHQFKKILSSHYLKLPFVNIWVFTLFQIEHFNAIDLKIDYTLIIRHREQALIARREKNFAWLKSYKGKLDTIDPWGKRAIIYSLEALPEAEVVPWLNLEARKGDILTKCACLLVIGKKNKLANQHDGNSKPSRI